MQPRVAMVGASYFARLHREGWRDCGVPVLALCDTDGARAAAQGARFQVPDLHTSAIAMMDAVRPTLLDVVLPPDAQAEVVHAALERGITTICQKPTPLCKPICWCIWSMARRRRTAPRITWSICMSSRSTATLTKPGAGSRRRNSTVTPTPEGD